MNEQHANQCARCGLHSTSTHLNSAGEYQRICLRCGWEYPMAAENALVDKWINGNKQEKEERRKHERT